MDKESESCVFVVLLHAIHTPIHSLIYFIILLIPSGQSSQLYILFKEDNSFDENTNLGKVNKF